MSLEQTERGDKVFTRHDVLIELRSLYEGAKDDAVRLKCLELILENTPREDRAVSQETLLDRVRKQQANGG